MACAFHFLRLPTPSHTAVFSHVVLLFLWLLGAAAEKEGVDQAERHADGRRDDGGPGDWDGVDVGHLRHAQKDDGHRGDAAHRRLHQRHHRVRAQDKADCEAELLSNHQGSRALLGKCERVLDQVGGLGEEEQAEAALHDRVRILAQLPSAARLVDVGEEHNDVCGHDRRFTRRTLGAYLWTLVVQSILPRSGGARRTMLPHCAVRRPRVPRLRPGS